MRPTRYRFLSWFLLATYAGIALLGEGLHALVPEGEHHHDHGIYVAHHTCNGECHHHDVHDGGEHGAPAHAALTAADSGADSHLCEICEFLFQAISQPAEVAAPIEWEPLVARAHATPQRLYSLVSLGPQAARGPPLVVA
jgi:hypothetical protein